MNQTGRVSERAATGSELAELDRFRTGSLSDVRRMLVARLGSDTFVVNGDRIELDLPNNSEAPPTRVLRVSFSVPESVVPQAPAAGSRLGTHGVPRGWTRTLCRIDVSAWHGIAESADDGVTCRWCAVRLLAAEVALGRPPHEIADVDVPSSAAKAAASAPVAQQRETPLAPPQMLSRPYEAAPERPRAIAREPFSVDPDELDRATLTHQRTQNRLAEVAAAAGATVLSPGPDDPDFDCAWDLNGATTVAEVKSLTPRNEARQLRLALGQVLDYQERLRQAGRHVRAIVVVDQQPSSSHWQVLFARHDVTLTTLEDAPRLFQIGRDSPSTAP
jgi:hypothetical protein